mmetsp:Transcript_6549/g.26317  ORF Transcript_6549/g.26317 Transcript_6549/m.26317 type:complete len:296 (+) Transcript_6549:3252-4139(+)
MPGDVASFAIAARGMTPCSTTLPPVIAPPFTFKSITIGFTSFELRRALHKRTVPSSAVLNNTCGTDGQKCNSVIERVWPRSTAMGAPLSKSQVRILVSVDDEATISSRESIATYVISPTCPRHAARSKPLYAHQIFTNRSSPPVTNRLPLALSTAQYAASLCARSVRRQFIFFATVFVSAKASTRQPPVAAVSRIKVLTNAPRDRFCPSARAHTEPLPPSSLKSTRPCVAPRARATARSNASSGTFANAPRAKSSKLASCASPNTSSLRGNAPLARAMRSKSLATLANARPRLRK